MQHKLRLVKNPSVVEGWEGPKTITKLIHDAYKHQYFSRPTIQNIYKE